MIDHDSHAAGALKRALVHSAEKAGCPIELLQDDFTRWASATFTGGKHLLKFAAARSEALMIWLARLPNSDLPIVGHLLADLVVIAVNGLGDYVEFHLEVFTVEERLAA